MQYVQFFIVKVHVCMMGNNDEIAQETYLESFVSATFLESCRRLLEKALCNLLLGRSNADNQNNETKLKIAVWPSNKCTLFFQKHAKERKKEFKHSPANK